MLSTIWWKTDHVFQVWTLKFKCRILLFLIYRRNRGKNVENTIRLLGFYEWIEGTDVWQSMTNWNPQYNSIQALSSINVPSFFYNIGVTFFSDEGKCYFCWNKSEPKISFMSSDVHYSVEGQCQLVKFPSWKKKKKRKERKTSCLEFITLPAIAMSSFQRKS